MLSDYNQWLWAFVGAVLGILSVGILIFLFLVIKEIRFKKLRNRRLLIRLDTARSMLREDMPFDALKIYQDIVKLVNPSDNKEIYTEIKKGEGESYLKLYNKTGKIDYLEKAIYLFEEALQYINSQEAPSDFGNVNFTLGTLYLQRAEYKDKEKNIHNAIKYLETSLLVYQNQETESQQMIYIQRLLGKAYYDIGVEDEIQHIKKSIDYNENALQYYTLESYPVNFAEISLMLGDLYNTLSDKENKLENLARSMLYFRQALNVYSSNDFPQEFGQIQMKLADSYIKLSRIEDKNRHLMNAIISYEEALRYFTLDKDPKKYSDIYRRIAEIYESFVSNTNEKDTILDNLSKVKESLHNALIGYEQEKRLEDSSDILIKLGDILLKEYEYLKNDKLLKEALDYYKRANDMRTKDSYPFEYAVIKKRIGDIYKNLARITNWTENIINARQSYVEALKIFSMDKYPFWYKEVKTAMDEIDRLTL